MRASTDLRISLVGSVSVISFFWSACAFAQTAPPAGAQATPPADSGNAPTASLDSVVVTGSRGLQRTVTTSPTPIDVITAADLAKTGKPDALSALSALVPSFNSPARAGGGTASIISTGALRGLNPDQTLVLVDGKRRHKSALINVVSSLYAGSVPSDLSLIPVSAIDHIEVLRDGAAAKYGSDAIAGVINIILRHGDDGGAVNLTGGGNMDRSDGDYSQADFRYGQKFGTSGFVDFFLQARDQEASNRANPISPSVQLYNLVNGAPDPREATANRLVTWNYGQFPQRTLSMGYNSEYNAGAFELYSFATFGPRTSDLNVTFRAPNNINALPQVYPNGFRPDQIIHEEDYQFVFGARGNSFDWDWDLSTSYGENHARETEDQSINASLGPTSPTSFYLGTLTSTEWVNSLDITRGFNVGENLQVSAGLQHRYETYRETAGDPTSYEAGNYVIPVGQPYAGQYPAPGAQGTSGITPADAGVAGRSNLAAYGEITYDATSSLTLDLAGRAEHYDDGSGSTVIGEASGRYEIAPWISVRGAASTGFRAPSLAQEIYSSTTGQFQIVNGNVELLQIKTLPVNSAAAVALGATPLKPETSTNFTGGIVLQPAENLDITLDAYQIYVDKRITLTGALTGSAITKILVENGLPSNITSVQYYTNAIDTKTSGVDIVGAYKVDFDNYGSMRFNAGFNYNETTITHIIPNPSALSALGPSYVLFNRVAQGNITSLLPKTKIFLGDVWNVGKWSFSSRLTRFGSYVIPQTTATLDRYFGAKWITDVEASYQLTDAVSVAVGANNLFNVYPSANGVYNVSLGSQQYGSSPPSPFGFTGGSYYGRISVLF
jgi:iron complex outermembrane receptor protein